MRTLPLDFYKRLDALLETGVVTWVVAIELTTGSAFYLTTSNQPIRHANLTWIPFPMKLGNFEDSGEGNLPSSSLTLGCISTRRCGLPMGGPFSIWSASGAQAVKSLCGKTSKPAKNWNSITGT